MEIKIKKVRVNDIEIGYMDEGTGEPLLMIMGMAGIIDYWGIRLLQRLSQHFRVIAFDNRGMGETSSGDRHFSIQQFTEDTVGFLDTLKIERTHVLGWSMGSMIAQEMAIGYPKKVDRLILYAGGCGGKESINPPEHIMKKLFDTTSLPMSLTETMLQLMVPAWWIEENPSFAKGFVARPMSVYVKSLPAVKKQVDAIMSWEGTCQNLYRISAKTLIIMGDEDIIFPLENSSFFAESIPDSRLEIIEGGGHGLIYQYRDLFADIVTNFLKEQP